MTTALAAKNDWLPLAEYSMKHQISISTLRRRIKAEDIRFRFDDGKYLILDDHVLNVSPKKMASTEEHRPSLNSEVQKNSVPATFSFNTQQNDASESVIAAANRLLADLKKAYAQILQEKEEQILQLREETVDLKTLIKVLESENSRLRN